MKKAEFIEKLREFSEDVGAEVLLNLRNSKGSPMSGRKLVDADGEFLDQFDIDSVVVIPKLSEEALTDGETSVSVDSSEV